MPIDAPDQRPTDPLNRGRLSSPRLERCEEAINWVTDQELEWWPFGFLKPSASERLTTLRVLALASLYGIPTGLFAVVVAKLLGESVTTIHLVVFPLWTCFVFSIFYRSTFAYFWNRRAAREASQRARRVERS